MGMDIGDLKKNDVVTTMRSVAGGFSYVMDLVHAEVEDHHKKVAYLAYRLAEEMQMPEQACRLSIIGGLLHDIGGVLEQGKISLMDLEANATKLSDAGANIVSLIPVDAPLADIVKYSQRPADDLLEMTKGYETVREWLKDNAIVVTIPFKSCKEQESEVHHDQVEPLLLQEREGVRLEA